MSLGRETVDGVEILTPAWATLDVSTAPAFRTAAEAVQAGRVILDLGKIRFLDSSGLGAILACMRQIQAVDGALRLCGVCKEVRATLELVRIHRLLELHDTREEALAAFGIGVPETDLLGLGF